MTGGGDKQNQSLEARADTFLRLKTTFWNGPYVKSARKSNQLTCSSDPLGPLAR